MSERILKALMQLFAIVCDVEDISGRSRSVVEAFLKQQLNQELVEEYLKIFDAFLEAQKGSDDKKKRKRTSVNSVKVLRICTQINEELAQKQKVVVLIRLLEFIFAGEEITEQEMEFVSTVAETFNIETEEFEKSLNFIRSKSAAEVFDEADFLYINNQKFNTLTQARHLFSDGITGHVRILRIKSVSMYVLRYFGNAELYLNGINITPERTYILTNGSSIRSSKVQPIYYSDIVSAFLSDASKEKIVFRVDELQYVFKGGNIGLYPLNFSEESGRLVGIMGASGAGKSTLLNLLNGNYVPTSGKVAINGIDIHHQTDQIEGVIGYVSQDDLLIEELTVFQNLYYNAKLCFANTPDNQLVKMVADMLMSIGLYEAKDLKVGSPLDKTISGGQRKRLNIALELIREPSVLFVDEPTSGLSSRDSENIMDLLKELALKGKLVFVVIHQPSSDIFKMFDRLLILDTGGFPIYNGNPVDAVIYFKKRANHVNSDESECIECGNVNPEQIFNIIEAKVVDEYGNPTPYRKVSPKEWNQDYLEHIEKKINLHTPPDKKPDSNFHVPNLVSQFKVFITRDILSKLTNTQYMLINLLEAPVLAFILAFLVRYYNTDTSNKIGYIFRENENVPAYIFMAVIVALFIGLTVSAEEIIRDKKIRKREQFLNLSKGSYLVSKISIMFVLSAIQTATFILVGNSLLGLKGMWIDYWFVLFTTSCFANMLGLNISATFNSAVTIYILIPFLIIPQLLLSGVIVKFDKLNPVVTLQNSVPLAGEVMTSRWAFEALAVNQFKSNKFEKIFYPYDKELRKADFKKNFWLSKLREKTGNCYTNIGDKSKEETVKQDLLLLKTEISKEMKKSTEVRFNLLEKLSYTDVSNRKDILDSVSHYLRKVNDYYIKKYNGANDKKDELIMSMNKDAAAKDAFILMKNDYTNDALSDLVTNKSEFNKILEKDGRLYQRADPVYLDPDDFRAHFFAPRKKVFGKYFSTYSVNLFVIWIISALLIITLYFDVFKRVLDLLEKSVSLLNIKKKRK